MTRRKYKPYPEYKDSGVEWLGRVPRHWRIAPVYSAFSSVKNSGFPDETLLSVYRDFGVVEKDSRDDNFNKASADLSNYQLVTPGCLVTNKMKTWQGSIAISKLRGIVSPAYYVYEPTNSENPDFLHHLVRSLPYICGYMASSKGIRVNQWDLDSDIFRVFPLLLPTNEEQSAIANYIDRETSRIDRLIEKKERFIELLKEKRQALITHAVTKGLPPEAAAKAGLDPNPPMRDSGIEWIGEVPAHWEVKKIKHLFSFTSGGTPPTDHREYWNGNLPWVSSKDMKANILLDTEDHITEEAVQRTSTSAVTKDTLLIVVRSGILRHSIPVAIAGVRMAINQDIKGLSPLVNRCSTHFLAWYIYGQQAQLLLAWRKEGATVESIDMESMQNFNISVPPTSEQDNICSYLSIENKRFEDLIQKTHLSISLLRERRTALITAAVTGQIDVRESISHRAGGKSQQEAPA